MNYPASVTLAIVGLVLALTAVGVQAQDLTVTPTNPTIGAGQTVQFAVDGAASALAVDAGSFHTCALLQNGAVWCWGLNDWGQLGDGTRTNSSAARPVTGLLGAVAVDGGGYHTCARFADGSLQCWGRNDQRQLGNAATTGDSALVPVPVTGITATAMTVGGFHTCALLADGTVQCWGQNDYGQLGNGLISPIGTAPGAVTGLSGVVTVSAGGWHTCALLNNGTVRCWGQNTYGALGDGTIVSSPFPVAVSGIQTAVAIESGIFHTCARLQDGSVQCWGRNDDAQLGNGTRTNSSVPTPVADGLTPASIAPGAEHSCVVFADGSIRCWGDNNFGQLGNGSPLGITATTPSSPVSGVTSAVSATSGAVHTCALLQGGAVQCWGMNFDGRLGDGTTTDRFTPVSVLGLEGVTWSSSDTAVATVSARGLATGQGPGATTITATSGARSGSTTLSVVPGTTLAVVREGAGMGRVTSEPAGIDCGSTCWAVYDQNTVVTLTATPASDSTFESWGGACSGSGPCTVALAANATVTARFGGGQPSRFRLSATKDGIGAGEIYSDPPGIACGTACAASYDADTVVTLTAFPGYLSVFVGWSGGGCTGTGPCTIRLRADTTVNATFQGINQ